MGHFPLLGKERKKSTNLPGLSGKPMEKSMLVMVRKLFVSFFLRLSTQTVKNVKHVPDICTYTIACLYSFQLILHYINYFNIIEHRHYLYV